jgi:hypothetical protein
MWAIRRQLTPFGWARCLAALGKKEADGLIFLLGSENNRQF